jgi:Xaa-Pro aminopeptidase
MIQHNAGVRPGANVDSGVSLTTLGPELAARIERLRASLAAAGAAGAIAIQPHLVFYLTSAEPPVERQAAVVVTDQRVCLLWPDATPAVPGWVSVSTYPSMEEPTAWISGYALSLGEILRSLRPRQGRWLAADGDLVPAVIAGDVLPLVGPQVFSNLVRTKSPHEVAIIRRNLAANDSAFSAVAAGLRPGVTDLEIALWCAHAMALSHQSAVSYAGNIGLGRNGEAAGARPTGVVCRAGDTLFVDLYSRHDHYVGDSCRSFVVDPAPAWAEKAHLALERALRAVQTELRPGVEAARLDGLCRAVLREAGLSGLLVHHTGHGTGLRAQEAPYLVPGSPARIRAGDVIAVEPGVYLEGAGGLRLEEVFHVTEGTAERLGTFDWCLTRCS